LIGVLTAAPWHNSIGDIATEEATLFHLAHAGVAAAPVSVGGTDVECLVIGGGDIIEHDHGHGHGEPWSDLLAHFRQPGRHVLNAVGVEPDIIDLVDWSFASDYRLVTVRDLVAADRLAEHLPSVRARPCPATLLEPLPLDFVTGMPGYEPLRELGRDYVVVHRHPAVAKVARRVHGRDTPTVAVDPQAWRQYPWRGPALQLPWLAVVAGARAVVTYSLHLAIFALSQSVPFAVVDLGADDGQSNKVRRYLARAGLEDAMNPLGDDPLRRAESLRARVAEVSSAERAEATAHLDDVVRVVSTD
jgi:Polysaccharide pyruvyl transferase